MRIDANEVHRAVLAVDTATAALTVGASWAVSDACSNWSGAQWDIEAFGLEVECGPSHQKCLGLQFWRRTCKNFATSRWIPLHFIRK